MNLEIEINNESTIETPDFIENKLEDVVYAVLEHEGFDVEGELSILFTDNEGIKSLNAEFRQKDAVTDVLSFPQYEVLYEEEEIPEYLYLGDIVISLEKAAEQAETFEHSFEREIFYLIVHSILHLLGYDHMVDEEQRVMREKEKAILKKLGIFKDSAVSNG